MRLRTVLTVLGSAFAIAAVGIGAFAWWLFNPNHEFTIHNGSGDGVRLVSDGPDVRRLFTNELARVFEETRAGEELLEKFGPAAIVERRQHPEMYFPEHVKFVEAMAHQPSVTVPVGSYARLLERSRAKCEADPSISGEYAKVRITSGPLRGKAGWLCYWRDLTPTVNIDSYSPPSGRPQLTSIVGSHRLQRRH
jgi:hypothetical protein